MSEQIPKRVLGEQYYNQVSESIRNVFELTTRIDERVQLMMKKQEELERKIDNAGTLSNAVNTRVSLLESKNNNHIESQLDQLNTTVNDLRSKVQELEGDTSRSGERWKQIMAFAVQLVWVIVAAYVLYKLHLQSPAVP
jgi:predicted nuclease with TOPRIM domain